ncbi:phage tail protein [Lysinibacillus sp. NPDC096212]|uniref:phage tail protein n=1 Tax=Lysinibacillus sp. NPDC096212 TaxID=3364135 RepID=UPI0038106BB7
MLIITNGNQTEPLIQFNNFQMEQEVKGNFTISFNTFNVDNNPAYHMLQVESVVTVEDYDFRVKQMKENRHAKSVTAISTFYDLIDTRKNEIYGGTRKFNEFLTFVLGGTAWRFTFDTDLNEYRLIENFGDNNIIALVQALCQVYECEYVIMPNNRIHFSKQVGGDYDAQYRYGYNVKALSKNVDTTNLKTYIEGYGAASESGGQLFVSYESPYAQKYGKREADPVHDDRFTNGQALVDHIRSMLTDFPEVTFELDSIELTNKELGERIWLIYEPMGMEFQTRILSQNKGFVNGRLTTISVVLGNRVPRSTSDILISQKVEIDENKKITRSKFEQTNDRITMEVETIGESISKLELTDKEIKLSVDETNKSLAEFKITSQQISTRIENKVDNLSSEFVQTSNEFRTSINDNGRAISTMRQDLAGFEFTVNSRFNETNSKITQTENQIRFEVVKKDEYNGRTITSMINQDPYAVSISADKINLNGAVMVNGTISGATSIQVTDNITVGNTLNIGQSWTGNYNINFGGGAGAMQIKAYSDQIILSAMGGVRIPEGYLNMQNGYAIGSNSYDLRLDHNGANRLYVRKNGYEYGWIEIVNK